MHVINKRFGQISVNIMKRYSSIERIKCGDNNATVGEINIMITAVINDKLTIIYHSKGGKKKIVNNQIDKK